MNCTDHDNDEDEDDDDDDDDDDGDNADKDGWEWLGSSGQGDNFITIFLDLSDQNEHKCATSWR